MKKINPSAILLSWIAGCFVVGVIVMVVLGATTPDGAQAPMEFLGRFVYIVIYGMLILSILIFSFFREWSKKTWEFMSLSFSFCCFLIIAGARNTTPGYSFRNVDTVIGDRKYIKRYEYYDDGPLRGISFFYNNQKDSIWIIYSESGKIISRKRYREGSLVEVLK
jgi:hypothetical protein